MPGMLTCPRGHSWGAFPGPSPEADQPSPHCPVCGGPAGPHAHAESLYAPPASPPGYEILAEIGRGGTGVVYQARALHSGRIVAIKMLSAGSHAAPADVVRFHAEVEALANLRHPNLLPVYEIGDLAGVPFFVVEFMDRGSLAHSLGNAALPPRYAAELLELLARTVQTAHEQGILHRDLKPANVLLSSPPPGTSDATLPGVIRLLGVPKITDFGLAKRIGQDGGITRTGEIMGTPAYMAPEQAEGRTAHATTAVDVYALGAILYEALTGRPPYEGATPLETLDKVRHGDPVPPDRVVPGLPPALVTVCLKAMAREPDHRYPSAASMADDLRRYLDDQQVLARREPVSRRLSRWARRQPAVAALSAAVAFAGVLCVLLALVVWHYAAAHTGTGEGTASVEYYGGVVRRWGVPEGVYRLTAEQVRRREVSFRVQRRGELVERVEAVDRHGRPTTRHSFVAYLERGDGDQPWRREVRWEYARDEAGELTRETALDRTGQVLWSFRYTTKTTGHYTDKRGFPRPRAGSGAAYVSFIYDKDGLVKELRYLAANGKARPDRNGIFGQRHDHDPRGFVVGISFLGHEDQPVLHPDGYAREVRRYDDRGNRVETAYVGLDALPVLGPSGLARKVSAYDADGNPTQVRAYGIDGGLTRRWEGYAIERRTYDRDGRLARLEYLGPDEKPARDFNGVARIDYRHSDGGQRREEAFFGPDGNPVKHRVLACTRLTRVRDDEEHEAELIAHDLDLGMSTRRELRFALPAPHVRRKHDARGNVVDEAYFALDGKPVTSWFGVHRVLTTYDDRGHRAEVRFEGPDGSPSVPRADGPGEQTGRGPARVVWKWDEPGNNVEVQALGADGKPDDGWELSFSAVLGHREGELLVPPGVARVAARFDERGNPTEISHLDRNGEVLQPVKVPPRNLLTRGRLRLHYDERGNMTEAALYGPDGGLAAGVGVSRVTVQHDEDGRVLESTLFGPEGRAAGTAGVSRCGYAYDQGGNRTREAYFDTQDRPVVGPSGYAQARLRYDQSGNLTESQFFDAEGGAVATRVVVEQAQGKETDLRPGDVLVRYAGQAITNTMQLHELKRREDVGRKPHSVEVMREGTMHRATLPTGLPSGEGPGRRWGRGTGGGPYWLLRAQPGGGVTPPLDVGGVRLRTEVVKE